MEDSTSRTIYEEKKSSADRWGCKGKLCHKVVETLTGSAVTMPVMTYARLAVRLRRFSKLFYEREVRATIQPVKPVLRSRWSLTPRQAMRLQERLRDRVVLEDGLAEVRYVAGADLAFDPETDEAFAGVIVYGFPSLEEVERRMARRKLRFPYVPGLLSFRESPILLAAFRRLRTEPDLILVDGHGIAHPRRFGIACHLGILLDKPTIGCAKSLLVGEHEEPGVEAGSTAPLMLDGERVGVVLRTRAGVKPIFVTQGHRVSLDRAVRLVKQCLDGFRIPKPTREADHYVRDLRRAN